MTEPLKPSSAGRQTGRLACLAGVIWTAVVFWSLASGLRQQRLEIMQQAESEAEAIANMDHSFRDWMVNNGGVYIIATETTLPDTSLRAPDKNIKTPSGLNLMLISHAYAMRQLSEARARLAMPHASIVASKPKNPAYAADDWERAAIAGFERGERENLSLYNSSRVRFISAFRLEPACLACHTSGESPGGVRGAISVSVPLGHLKKISGRMRSHWITGHLLVWLAGLLTILLSYKHLRREYVQRETLLAELTETLAQVKYLSGFIPICASCKKIRNKDGDWESVEQYVAEHSDAKFSHSVCPDCGKKVYGKYYEETPPAKEKPGQ